MRRFFTLFFLIRTLSAMYIGNPAEPVILEKGIALKPYPVSFRFGYLDDWIYKQKFQVDTDIQLSTYAGLLTFNFAERLDVYGIVGSSRIRIDEELYTKRALAWGVGGKFVIARTENWFFGLDAKYFETAQNSRYFVVDDMPYNVVTNHTFTYSETQVALGVAYRARPFCPYVNATYISTTIAPDPLTLLVRLPDENIITDIETQKIISVDNWGIAIGLTLIDCDKAALSCEWRGLNQYAANVNFDIRF